MTRPKLGELAHYAEIIAAIAVVISLLYVGRQVQDNTAAIRSASIQSIADTSDAALRNIAADKDLSRIRLVGDEDYSALSEPDAHRYRMFMRGTWIRMQNIYAQRQIGVLEDSFWSMYSKIICEIYASPGVKSTWPGNRVVLDDEFVAIVENCSDEPDAFASEIGR